MRSYDPLHAARKAFAAARDILRYAHFYTPGSCMHLNALDSARWLIDHGRSHLNERNA